MGEGPLAGKQIHVFVNPTGGNDANKGRNASSAKKSIQAAWDSLPDLVLTTATIHLANGTYHEEVKMNGKSVLGKGKIAVVGNVDSPNAVVITGATDTSRKNVGLDVDHVEGLSISGVMVDNYARHCLRVTNRSNVEISNCKFFHADENNVHVVGMVQFKMGNSEIAYNASEGDSKSLGSGILIRDGAIAAISNCNIHGFGSAGSAGMAIHDYAVVRVENTTVSDVGKGSGYYTVLSHLSFLSPCIVRACNEGVVADYASCISWPYSKVNVVNCRVPYNFMKNSTCCDDRH